MNKNILVVTNVNASNTDDVYYQSLVAKQVQDWKAEGIGDLYLEEIGKAYYLELKKGHLPRIALRRIFVEIEEARSETLFDSYISKLSAKFHLPKTTAMALITQARQHHHKNRRPTFEQAISPIFTQVKHASLLAYQARRAQQSKLAEQLVQVGVSV